MEKHNSVNILLGAYNGQRFLREQLDSILAQTDQDWKLILSDDESTDASPDILAEYAEKYPNQCVFHRSGKRFGTPHGHYLHLLQNFPADFMFLSDQDDYWFPEKISRVRKILEDAEQVYGREMPVLVFHDLIPTDEDLNPLADSFAEYQSLYTQDFDYRSILMRNVVTGNSLAVNQAAVELALLNADQEKILLIDWWLAAVTARFGKIIYVPEALGFYRQHQQNQVGAKNVHSAEYYKNNISNLTAVKQALQGKKHQAKSFRETYEEMLTAEDIAFLKKFEQDRSGPVFYWKNRNLIHSHVLLAGMMVMG